MGYLESMIKLENGKELSEADKLECVADVLNIDFNLKIDKDSEIVKKITDQIGSMWTDAPMPVAWHDIRAAIRESYQSLVAG